MASIWTHAGTRALALVAALMMLLAGAAAAPDARATHDHDVRHNAKVRGVVQVDGDVGRGWTVELYASGRDGARLVGRTTTGGDGSFQLNARRSSARRTLYLLASRGAADRMLVALGSRAEVPRRVVVNELATIATIWTHAQLIDGDTIQGNAVGLASAARNVPNLVDLSTGQLGEIVLDTANLQSNTAATMGTLASLLAECLTRRCPDLFELATPPGEDAPDDTVEAFGDIARNPWHNVPEIFRQLELPPAAPEGGAALPAYIPTLLYPPTAFTLSLNYTRGGFNAPGGLQIDSRGDVWTNNNFVPGSQSVLLAIGDPYVPDPDSYSGTGVTKLRSNGDPVSPRTGFLGGGTFGAAFGLAIDRDDHAWVGNLAGNSLTELASDGTPISPDADPAYSATGGYTDAGLVTPQDTIVTVDDSVWTANLLSGRSLDAATVTQVVGGDPDTIRTWGSTDCPVRRRFGLPWGLASDDDGTVFVTDLERRSVWRIDPSTAPGSLCPTERYPLDDAALPQGIAIDSQGNLWVADTYGDGQVTFLDASDGYAATSFDGEGTTVGPWSVAVDGADNVWIADFFGKRIVQLCGAAGDCPDGTRQLGDRISPAGVPARAEVGDGGGYGANGVLQSITAINVDQAGNVWAANNFNDLRECLLGEGFPDTADSTSTVRDERIQTDCGGNGAVVVFGAAAPVAAPMIGLPEQPDGR